MILGAPAFEREMRRRVREEMKRSPALRLESRRNRKTVRRQPWLERSLFPVFFTVLAIGLSVDLKHPGTVLVLLSLASAAAVFHWAHAMLSGLYQSTDLAVLMHLPISDETFVRFQWAKVVRSSGWMLLVTGGVMSAYLAARGGGILELAAGLGAALVHWQLLLAAALALLLFRPGWPLQPVGWAFRGTVLVALLARDSLAGAFAGVPFAWLLALPTGWVPYALREGILGSSSLALTPLLPAAVVAGLGWRLHRQLLARYVVKEVMPRAMPSPEAILEYTLDREMALRSEYDEALVASPELKPVLREELRRSIPALFEERIRGRAFLGGIEWATLRPLERLFGRWLTPRQKLIAEVLLVAPPSWSRRWMIALGFLAAGVGLAFVPGLPPAAGVIASGVATLIAWPVFGGAWGGLKMTLSAGLLVPVFASFPIHPREVASVLGKANVIRWAAWLPVIVAGEALIDLILGGAWGLAVIAAKAGLLVISAQPWMVLLQFGDAITVQGRRGWRTWTMTWLIVACILLWIAGVLALWLPIPPPLAWGFGIATLLPALAALRCGQWIWTRGRVDWIGRARS